VVNFNRACLPLVAFQLANAIKKHCDHETKRKIRLELKSESVGSGRVSIKAEEVRSSEDS